MKQIFKKISAIAASALMMGMSLGVAAAANYPSPFTAGDTAIVYGSGTGVSQLDSVSAANIQADLSVKVGTGTGTGGGSVTGGDSVLLAKSSDKLNINNTWSVFSGTVTKDNLKTLLKDGTYAASDNDEFDYEQKIALGTPELKHFRDSDYESLVGLTAKTPVVGFRLTSNTPVLNYTLDFLTDVTSDVVSSRMDDIEGSDIPLMGRTYYVSELQNGSSTTSFGKLVLLDAATVGSVKEGETATVAGHTVSIDWIDPDEVVFMVDSIRAPASGKLVKGNSYKLADGSYIGVRDISSKDVSGTVGSASFSMGTGKLELPSFGADIKMNDETITNLKGWVYKSTGDKLDKIVIEWKTDGEDYLSPTEELKMPGFDALKFTMNNLVRNPEEKIIVEKDGDTAIELTLPIKRGEVAVDILYSNASGEFAGVGKSATERLATTNSSTIRFFERQNGADYHKYFFATYNVSKEGQSYLLRAQVSGDVTAGRNETTIQSYENGAWVDACVEKANGDTCNIGDVTLTMGTINYTSGGDESVNITAGTNVNFRSVITPGGLVVYLPFGNASLDLGSTGGPVNGSTVVGALDLGVLAESVNVAGHSFDSFYLTFNSEDKDETLGTGKAFSLTINDNTDNNLQVQHVNTTGGNDAGSGSGGLDGLEIGDTSTYEAYVKSDVAPRILHYTQPDEDWAELYYPTNSPTGSSETYGEVFLAEAGAILVPGTGGQLGLVLVKDTEVSTVSSKNLIVVGGSCINSVAANLVGGAYCGNAWTEKTGVGTGQFLIKSYSGKYTAGKIALLVAGYEAADTTAATTALINKVIDTSKEYRGTTSTTTVTEVTAA
ncbi:MAG: hypothetical protein Q7S06_02005 [Nanoarchaeota archaeon]|nr:hypothetical protein [Nanoarchaeota archaeon]